MGKIDGKKLIMTTDIIRDFFEDELSRYIFDNRIKYKETKDVAYINNIVKRCCPKLFSEKESFARLISDCDKPIFLWGGGERAKNLIYYLGKNKDNIKGIIDRDENKWGQEIGDIKIIPPDILADKECVVIITPVNKAVIDEIEKSIRLINGSCIIVKASDYVNEVVAPNQYFEDYIRLEEGEVFVDAGAYDLETTIEFFNRCKNAGITNYKSIAFEPSEELFNRCKKRVKDESILNIRLEQFGIWSKKERLTFNDNGDGSKIDDNGGSSIDVIDLDSVVNEKVTFIKMDVEGAEIEAIKGAMGLITKYRPKLAISVYHKPNDVVDIPALIKSAVPEYRLCLGHYTATSLETVLYAL